MWKSLKPKLTKIVMWSVKNHWIFLVSVVGTQYFMGKVLTGSVSWLSLDRVLVLKIHSTLGFLILVSALGLTLDKLYLWLIKKGKV